MTEVIVTQLEVKSHDAPDEHRTAERTRIEVNHLGEYSVGRFTFEPGWRWSDCIKPIVDTDSCQNNHVGYCISGTLEVQTDAGARAVITAGDSFSIPPGHDAYVVGDHDFVSLELLSAPDFAVHDHLQRPRLR
ncbi:cupin domain-containing protein [Leifsonia sp. YAF41]|uniref:cupin domain-containing protein n=1 Tax=Leifsonia sp. YAF41 TaxID=3233086 RepID=UPI003F9B96DA